MRDEDEVKLTSAQATSKKVQGRKVAAKTVGDDYSSPVEVKVKPALDTDTLPNALALLDQMIRSVFGDLRDLETTMRCHMPNHLYEDVDDGCDVKTEDGYSVPNNRRSPSFLAVVEAVNDLHRMRNHILYLQNNVVV